MTTIIYNRVLAQDSRKLGVLVDADQDNAPRSAQLKAYQAAQWGAFCFAMIGTQFFPFQCYPLFISLSLATILVVIFFRRVGIIGVKGGAHGAPGPAPQPDDDKPTNRSSLTVTQSQDLEKMVNSPPHTPFESQSPSEDSTPTVSPAMSTERLETGFQNIAIASPTLPSKPL